MKRARHHLDKPYISQDDLNLKEFIDICKQQVSLAEYANAYALEKNILIYEGGKLRKLMEEGEAKELDLKSELYNCLQNGPGVFVIRNFYDDLSVVDRSSVLFAEIIEREKVNQGEVGDHFAKAGANERIWNSFQKICEADPAHFIAYYKNPLYKLVSEAWLGPGYQITAQVNVVKPGGAAQSAHRDYHLGFQLDETVAQYPLTMQVASQYLTLQGAIVHSDMPLETGPTLLLPFSQQYPAGYLAYRNEAFKAFFLANAVQLPLKKGDALFFSPALFHAAGNNHTNNDRTANLIQVSSAFGKTMESIDRYKMMNLIYPHLLAQMKHGALSDVELLSIILATGDGYAFPTNLDKVQPIGGAAPENMVQLVRNSLKQDLSFKKFSRTLEEHQNDRKA